MARLRHRGRRRRLGAGIVGALVVTGWASGGLSAQATSPVGAGGAVGEAVAPSPRPGTDAHLPGGPASGARRSVTSVTSVTGQEYLLEGSSPGVWRVTPMPHRGTTSAAAGTPGEAMTVVSDRSSVYVIPSSVRPLAGRLLDLSLFDLVAVSQATQRDGRIPVRIAYTGPGAPTLPGVTLTSSGNGTASGYLTPARFSAGVSGRAKAATPAGAGPAGDLAPGITSITLDRPVTSASGTRRGRAGGEVPTQIRVLDGRGRPADDAQVLLLNAEDCTRRLGSVG